MEAGGTQWFMDLWRWTLGFLRHGTGFDLGLRCHRVDQNHISFFVFDHPPKKTEAPCFFIKRPIVPLIFHVAVAVMHHRLRFQEFTLVYDGGDHDGLSFESHGRCGAARHNVAQDLEFVEMKVHRGFLSWQQMDLGRWTLGFFGVLRHMNLSQIREIGHCAVGAQMHILKHTRMAVMP